MQFYIISPIGIPSANQIVIIDYISVYRILTIQYFSFLI